MDMILLCSLLRLAVKWSQGLTAPKTTTQLQKIPRDLKIGTHQPYQPADPLAQGDFIEEAQPHMFTFLKLCKHSGVLRVSHLEMKMGSETGSGPALQNQKTNLLREHKSNHGDNSCCLTSVAPVR